MNYDSLPNDWLVLEIGDIAKIVGGGTPKSSDTSNFEGPGTGIAWLTPADLSRYKHQYISYGARDLSKKGHESCSAKLMPEGSVLFSSRAPIGYVAIAENEISTNQGFKSFVFTKEIEPKFAYYYLKSIRDLAESRGTGTTFKELSGATVKKLPFIIAPQAEQQQIASKLDELLAQVDIIKTRLDTIPKIIKRFRQSVLAAAVSGKLTEDWRIENHQLAQNTMENYFENKVSIVEDKEKYFNEPIQWKWVRFSSQVKLINGDRGKNYPNVAEYVSAGLPFINTGHIEPNGTLSKERMNYITRAKFDSLGGGKIETNDLVYCLRGATMGKTAMVAPLKEGAIASSLVIVRPKESIITSFTYLFLISPQGKDLILRYDNGSAQPNLSAKSLGLYPLALPPLVEQAKIVNRVEQLFTYADQIEQRVKDAQAKVNHLTQSILAKAFRGELTADWREQNSELISGENSAAALLERIKLERSMAAKCEKVKPTRVKKNRVMP